jgi:hypothetical protein
MNSPAPQTAVGDEREMATTELDLGRSNPGVAPDVIHTLVRRAYARLTPAKVHTYLPILVVREVQADLRGQAA